MSHLTTFCRWHKINIRHVKIGCDEEGAINAIRYTYEVAKSGRKHYDVIQWIQQIIRNENLTWSFVHVIGHQDDIKEYHELTRLEQRNIEADSSAKNLVLSILSTNNHEHRHTKHIVDNGCSIWWTNKQGDSRPISSYLKKNLSYHIKSAEIRQYWEKKAKFPTCLGRHVDWKHLQKSLRSLNKGHRQWLSKWFTGFTGVGNKTFTV